MSKLEKILKNTLSKKQQEIVFKKKDKFVVRACPGSGKTYSVAARLTWKVENWVHPHQGIAALSFTNVAWQEIKNMLENEFNLKYSFGYPHFLGTIDSFVNQYIFLPFGHKVMGCKNRPVLVGEPHGSWFYPQRRGYQAYNSCFDKFSFDIKDNLLKISDTFESFFGNINIFGTGHENNIKQSKGYLFKEGYSNQADGNYFAMKILEKYPKIAEALVFRFPELIIDEAQDTSEIQMRIIDLLIENGLKEIMLVGDPDQAIFEWNDAKPELFEEKYSDWKNNSIKLNENRRSSQNICNFTYNLSSLNNTSEAISDGVKNFSFVPEIIVFDQKLYGSIKKTIDHFLNLCKGHGISVGNENVAIVYRSRDFVFLIDNIKKERTSNTSPWKINDRLTKDFVQGKYFCDNKKFKEGFKIIEKAVVKAFENKNYCLISDIKERIDKTGFVQHRLEVYKIYKQLPDTKIKLDDWVKEAKASFSGNDISIKFDVKSENAGLTIEALFATIKKELFRKNYRLGTVHSVKGETFEAVLLFLKKKGVGKKYKTLLEEGKVTTDNEELRIVYVGITRPRKLLVMAVPSEEDKLCWENRLKYS
ncbi:MAG: ATP-dependent helicase [Candidatus Marinimicrobia bacterium]|nr:ATP-dependent helicase [Candidatus Neomarinimicrobiota bacterium]